MTVCYRTRASAGPPSRKTRYPPLDFPHKRERPRPRTFSTPSRWLERTRGVRIRPLVDGPGASGLRLNTSHNACTPAVLEGVVHMVKQLALGRGTVVGNGRLFNRRATIGELVRIWSGHFFSRLIVPSMARTIL